MTHFQQRNLKRGEFTENIFAELGSGHHLTPLRDSYQTLAKALTEIADRLSGHNMIHDGRQLHKSACNVVRAGAGERHQHYADALETYLNKYYLELSFAEMAEDLKNLIAIRAEHSLVESEAYKNALRLLITIGGHYGIGTDEGDRLLRDLRKDLEEN